MAIKQEAMMELIVAGKELERLFLALKGEIKTALGSGDEFALAKLYAKSLEYNPNPVHTANLTRYETYYKLTLGKNNYRRRHAAKKSGKLVLPIEVPEDFPKSYGAKGRALYSEPEFVIDEEALTLEAERLMKIYDKEE